MEDGVDLPSLEEFGYGAAVAVGAQFESCALVYGGPVPRRKVVENGDFVAGGNESLD